MKCIYRAFAYRLFFPHPQLPSPSHTHLAAIMSSPYPTAYQIEEMFANRDVPSIFNTYLADNVDVVIIGGEDFHLGARHQSAQSFHDGTYGAIGAALKMETFKVEVLRVIGGGDSAWAAVESLSTATSKSGKSVSVGKEYRCIFRS